MNDPRVTVIAPDGTPGTVPASQVKGIVDAGGKLPGKNEAAAITDRAQLEDKYDGTVEGTVAPLVAGAARGLSLGTSDVALSKLGLGQKLRDYQKYAPVASTGGELGGIALGSLFGDEAGLADLPGVVSKIGRGAGAATEEALGGGLLARGAGALAQGATEGGVYGGANAVSESYINDAPLTGEALIGGVTTGAAGGMIASGLIHGAGSALGGLRGAFRPSAGAFDAMAERQFGEAAPGLGRTLAEKTPSLGSVAADEAGAGPYRTPGTRGAADAVGDAYVNAVGGDKASELGNLWKNREIAFNDGAERIEQHSRDVQKAITEQQAAAKVTDMATFGDSKVNHMDKLVDRENFTKQADVVMQWMFKAQDEINTLASDTAVTKLGPAARKEFDSQMQRLGTAMESGDSLKLFKAADDTKRFLGRNADFGRRAQGLTESAKAFDALYQGKGGLMSALEDPAWGKAAAAQKAVNAATTESIGLGRKFGSSFVEEYGSTAGRPDYRANSEKVTSFLGRLTKAANDGDVQAAGDFIRTRRGFLDATAREYDHGPEAVHAIAKERAALDRMEKTFKSATEETALINQAKRMQGEEQAHHVGGLLGLATDAFSRPVTTLQRLAQIESHTQSVLKKIQGGSERLAGVGGKTADAAANGDPKGGKGFFSLLFDGMGKAASKGSDAARSTASAAGAKAFDKRADAIAALQSNPAQLTERVGNALGPFGSTAPKVTGAATMTALNGLSFLSSKMPPSRQDPFTLQPQLQRTSRASDSEIAQHARYLEALDNPTIVLTEASKGTLTRDHVDAVKAVYPRLYAQMQTQVMQSLVDSESPLPYGKRIQLGILLDIPTDKTLSPEFQAAIQATYAPAGKAGAESPPPTLAAPLNIAGSLSTGTQTATAEGLEKT